MGKSIRFVGLDVHAETIAVAVAEGGEARSVGIIPNRAEAVRRLLGKLGDLKTVRVCYEAGPTGYALYWQLTKLGVQCDVIAPSLVPTKPGDRVKTDRRDAERLARSYRSGELTAVWVPDAKHEAIRDLVRAREAAKEDQLRAKHRLGKYLLRYGVRAPDGCRAWTAVWWQWVRGLQFDHPEQNTTLVELILEVDHQGQRIERFDGAIDRAITDA
ncbi:MAG TPA: transposase, partial [Gemmatimonadaceae bacterium]|nr:transposase [Gemmatimonadaceae bacterium]